MQHRHATITINFGTSQHRLIYTHHISLAASQSSLQTYHAHHLSTSCFHAQHGHNRLFRCHPAWDTTPPLYLKTKLRPAKTPHIVILTKILKDVNTYFDYFAFLSLFCIFSIDTTARIDYNQIIRSLFHARNIILASKYGAKVKESRG